MSRPRRTDVPTRGTAEPPPHDAWQLSAIPAFARHRATPESHRAPVLEHRRVADRYRLLRLHAPHVAANARPGQFVMLTAARADDATPVLLPRPMAVYLTDAGTGTVDVLYGVVGAGTRALAGFTVGETMLVVGPLGRGFEIGEHVGHVLLLGRGIGTCSLTTIAQQHRRRLTVTAVTSARHPAALIGGGLYRELGVRAVHEVTDDTGDSDPETLRRRLCADLDPAPPQLIATCGSQRLTTLCERLADRWSAEVQISVEAHMACGLGYCHGCASGAHGDGVEGPLICTDGPVFAWRREDQGGAPNRHHGQFGCADQSVPAATRRWSSMR